MRAVVMRAFGPPDVLQLDDAFPPPARAPGEVLVRVAAAGVNPVDVKTRLGMVPRALVALPRVLGADVAGVVEEADPGSGFKKGDRVFGCTGQHWFGCRYGAYAELVSAPADALARVPEGLPLEAAAGAPLAALTAWQALAARMPLGGKRVLVHAGSGGVGSFALQIAKAQGAHVTTTCSGRNTMLCTGTLGADVAVDYTQQRFEEVAPGPYDIIVDGVGGDYERRSLPLLRRRGAGQAGGHYANILTGWNARYGNTQGTLAMAAGIARGALLSALGLGPSYGLTVVRARAPGDLQQICDLLAARKVVPLIDRVLPLSDAAAAHAHVESGRARGKVVLSVADL